MPQKDAFEYQTPSEQQIAKITMVREKCKELRDLLVGNVPDSRERSLAITKLEEVSMWSNKAIVFN
jgi:hypothetical protein